MEPTTTASSFTDHEIIEWRRLVSEVRRLPYTEPTMTLIDMVWDTREPSIDLAGFVMHLLGYLVAGPGCRNGELNSLGLKAELLARKMCDYRDSSTMTPVYPMMPRLMWQGQEEPRDEWDRHCSDFYNLLALSINTDGPDEVTASSQLEDNEEPISSADSD